MKTTRKKSIRRGEHNSDGGTMPGGNVPANVKITSVLRRVSLGRPLHYVNAPALEGNVCAFQLAAKSPPILLESVSGRMQTVVAGDVFLGTPGARESNIVLVGGA
jgi:hypothetical protein